MKKIVSLLLALALCAGLGVPALAAGFSDVPAGHTFYNAIMDCADKGIVGGYSDGTFRPAGTVTKSNFAVMLSRAFYANDIARHNGSYNLATYGPFAGNYLAAYYNGAFEGASFWSDFVMLRLDTMSTEINRYDMAQLLANVLKGKGVTAGEAEKDAAAAKIADCASIPSQYRDAVKTAFAKGLIGGYADGCFHGERTMNRGQAAAVIYRAQRLVPVQAAAEPAPSAEAEQPEAPAQKPGAASAGYLTNGKAITVENVVELLAELRANYPDDTDFRNGYAGLGSGRNPNSNCIRKITNQYWSNQTQHTSTTFGCGGWAAFVEDSLFGQDATFRPTTVDKVRPGDLVIQKSRASGYLNHVAVVYTEPVIYPYSIYYGSTNDPIADEDWDYYITRQYTTTDAGTSRDGIYFISWGNTYGWTVDSRNPGVMFGDNTTMKAAFDYYTAYPE